MRKRGVRIKKFSSTSTTSTSVVTIPRSPLSPPSSTSQSASPTPTLSPSTHSSPDSLSPLTPPLPSHPSSSDSKEQQQRAPPPPAIDAPQPSLDTDALLASSLSSLSSSAPRHVPPSSPLYSLFAAWDELRATLPPQYHRWQSIPLTARLCALFLCLFYFLLFSYSTHLLLLTLYAALLCALLSARSVVEERGLLSLVPPSALPYLSDYSLIQLSHMALSSQLTGDLIALLCFDLSDAETRVLMQRIPAQWRRALVRRGVIGLLPSTVTALLFPRRRVPAEALEEKIEVIDDSAVDDTVALSLTEEVEGKGGQEHLTSVMLMERKYDDDDYIARVHASMSSEPPMQHDSRRLSLSAMPSPNADASSYASLPPPASPALSDEEMDPSSVTLSSLIDRRVSSSLSILFRSWAKQSYTALYDSLHDLLPSTLTSSSSLHFFVPLASAITAMHLVSWSPRARSLIRRSQPYVMDGAVCVAAVGACHHLYHHLIESFNRRREERRVAHGGALSGGQLARVYAAFVYQRIRQERGLYVSGLVLFAWLLYLAKGRGRLRLWWERRELLRLGAAAQVANRLAL